MNLPTAEQIYQAMAENGDNKTAAARQLGIHRQTLRELMVRLGMEMKPTLAGEVESRPVNVMELPKEGEIKVYVLTAAQNNTWVHAKFLKNLLIYCEHRNAQLMVARFTYNKTAFNNTWLSKPKRNPTDADYGLWYDEAILPYVCDDPDTWGSCRFRLAPDLLWCAEANIVPTNVNPLAGRDTYAGNSSAVFPHAKFALKSMPRSSEQPPRILYTTGTVTQLNYIQRNAGQKAEFHHCYGAIVVEVNSNGDWWARHINADSNGSFYDCPGGLVTKVSNAKLTQGHAVEAINWGDVHASQIDPEVEEVNWGKGFDGVSVVDKLRPRHQLLHDFLSFESRSHHTRNNFGEQLRLYFQGKHLVYDEIEKTYQLLQKIHRPWCRTVVVNSNHDRHPLRWLNEADYKHDIPNCEFFLEAQLARVRAYKAGDEGWNFLQWAMQKLGDTKALFLKQSDSYLIGPEGHQIECGLHGDQGPNGSRGSTANLAKLGYRINKGHDHSATVFEGAHSAGACQMDMGYNEDPTTWSISHIVTYLNGKRAMLTQRAGRLWA